VPHMTDTSGGLLESFKKLKANKHLYNDRLRLYWSSWLRETQLILYISFKAWRVRDCELVLDKKITVFKF
jgi:hypothetical protein